MHFFKHLLLKKIENFFCEEYNIFWYWDSEKLDKSCASMKAYFQLLDDFRPDTPKHIIDIFKGCVEPDRRFRYDFKLAKYVIIFL